MYIATACVNTASITFSSLIRFYFPVPRLASIQPRQVSNEAKPEVRLYLYAYLGAAHMSISTSCSRNDLMATAGKNQRLNFVRFFTLIQVIQDDQRSARIDGFCSFFFLRRVPLVQVRV